MMFQGLDGYLHELQRELRRRGVLQARIVEEVRGHMLDAIDEGNRQGLLPDAAVQAAIDRFGPASSLAREFAAPRNRTAQKILIVVSVTLGLLIAYIDTRPMWDDTGISAGLVLTISGILGALGPRRPWLWALCVGSWIPLFGILDGWNTASLLALAVAFVGAYGGMLVRRVLIPT